jgi:hypothetical protein
VFFAWNQTVGRTLQGAAPRFFFAADRFTIVGSLHPAMIVPEWGDIDAPHQREEPCVFSASR